MPPSFHSHSFGTVSFITTSPWMIATLKHSAPNTVLLFMISHFHIAHVPYSEYRLLKLIFYLPAFHFNFFNNSSIPSFKKTNSIFISVHFSKNLNHFVLLVCVIHINFTDKTVFFKFNQI